MRIYTVPVDDYTNEDYDGAILAIAADTAKEARVIAYRSGNFEQWINIKPKWEKGIDVSGLQKGVISDFEGLRRGVYGWVEMDCPKCGNYDICYLQDDGSISCEKCSDGGGK